MEKPPWLKLFMRNFQNEDVPSTYRLKDLLHTPKVPASSSWRPSAAACWDQDRKTDFSQWDWPPCGRLRCWERLEFSIVLTKGFPGRFYQLFRLLLPPATPTRTIKNRVFHQLLRVDCRNLPEPRVSVSSPQDALSRKKCPRWGFPCPSLGHTCREVGSEFVLLFLPTSAEIDCF